MRAGSKWLASAALVAACALVPAQGWAATDAVRPALAPAQTSAKNTPDLSATKSFTALASTSFRMAASLLYSGADSKTAEFTFSPWGSLSVTGSQPQRGLLGNSFGRLPAAGAVQASANLELGSGWVTSFSYSQSISQLNLRSVPLASDADGLRAGVVGVSISKNGLFGKSDALGFGVSQPVRAYSGGPMLGPVPKVDLTRGLVPRDVLPGGGTETDLEVGYVTTFFSGALALQANAGYQVNAQGEKGTNSISVLSRAKINF